MAGAVEGSANVKEALFEALSAVLSVDQYIRNTGEEQMKALEVTEEYGVFLAEFTVDSTYSLAIRQLASVMLKQYVEVHWSQHSDKYRAPETTEAAKSAIRRMLPVGLHEPVRRVRTSVAYAVSAIAHWDWPEAWPELFQLLMEALASGDPVVIHGAMRVLTEFCREVTDQSMPQVASVILPEMYKIFTQPQMYSLRTRGRAVNIFDTCVGMLVAMNEYHKGLAKQILFPILPQFMDVFVKALQATDDGVTSDSGLKMEVLKALTTLLKSFPSRMSQWLSQVLGPVWLALTQSAAIYMRTTVNALDDANDPTDSDGEVLGFESLVLNIFDLIHALVETSKYRQVVKKSIEELIYYIFFYMQITEEQAKLWSTNPDQFVEDEDEETYSYSVRISAHDLLLLLAAEFTKDAAPALCSAVTRHLQEAEQARLAGNVHWWKIHEATMLGVGSLSKMLMEHVAGNKLALDINTFLQNVVLVDLNQNVSPFLLGRCLCMASRFATAMNAETLQRFLQATVTGIHVSQPPCVRISAVRAVSEYCEHLRQNETMHTLQPFIGDMVEGLLNISTLFNTDVIGLCLETLCVVLEVDAGLTALIEPKVSPLVIAIFLKYSGDPLIVSLAQDVISVIAKNEACIVPLQQRLLPTLISILQSPVDKIPFGLQSISLDILTVLVRRSSLPIPDSLINQAFPATIHCTLQTDDNSTMQSGGECLRAFVSVALDKVLQWHDGQDCNGIYYIVKVVSKLLDSKTSEYTATHVGRLVSILITKMGSGLGDYLDLMLRAVLSKMQQAETHTVIQSLVLVFAHLMHTQMSAVLDFLSSVPSPTGRPALEFVLTEWCAQQHNFVGEYDRKVSCLALSKLIQYALESHDSRLQDISVQGDQILNLNEGVKTRSKAQQAPDQFTTVPLLVKVYKLLIHELSSQLEKSASTRGTAGDEDEADDDEDGEWQDDDDDDDDDMHGGESLPALLSLITAGDDLADYADNEEDEDQDEDVLNESINQVDLQTYLTEFLRSFSALPCYATFSNHHTEPEYQVLRTVGIAI